MIQHTKKDGYLVIANCFSPVIKCHLPQTFHFRYTFDFFAKQFGLEVVGLLENSHATIFRKTDEIEPKWKRIRFYEKLSKMVFPVIETLKPVLRPIKRLIRR